MPGVNYQARRAIADRWLTATLKTYPDQTAQFLIRERDPFRNPLGTAFREAIPIIVDEICQGLEPSTVARRLEGVIRIRAIQGFTPSQAVGFVFLLKSAAGAELPVGSGDSADLDQRVDELALAAFDLYARCREQLYEVRLHEAGRRSELLEKIASGVEGR